MNETVVQAILGYLESSEPPGIDWPRHWFEEVCFSRWAAEELVNLILDHPLVPAEDTIDEFAIKMTAYAATSDGKEAGRIFSIAGHLCLGVFGEHPALIFCEKEKTYG